MKRKRNNTKRFPERNLASTETATRHPLSPRRRWYFRLAALLFPLLVLGLLELALRVTGYGQPTTFFLKAHDNGRATLTDNPWFGWRFFPPAVARAPRPLYLARQKPPDTVRILCSENQRPWAIRRRLLDSRGNLSGCCRLVIPNRRSKSSTPR